MQRIDKDLRSRKHNYAGCVYQDEEGFRVEEGRTCDRQASMRIFVIGITVISTKNFTVISTENFTIISTENFTVISTERSEWRNLEY